VRAAGYYRISQANGHEEAPEIWEGAIQAYCQRKGYEVAEMFADLDVSGGLHPLRRGGFGEWYEHRDGFDVLVAPSIDRLSRDTVSGLETARRLYDEGVPFEICDTPVDMSTAAGRAQFSYVLVGATMYREQRGEAWKRARAHAAGEGRLSARRCPYGYRYEPGTKTLPIPDPQTAPVVQEIFRRKVNGEALHSIAADLTRRAVPTPRGARQWARQTVRRVITNEFYICVQTVDGVRYTGEWEPLISEATFEAANAQLSGRSKSWSSGVASPLTGLVRCAECNEPMYRHRNAPQDLLYRCQACHKAISALRIEIQVVEQYLDRLHTKYAKKTLADPDAPYLSGDDADELKRLEQRQKLLQRRTDAWLDELGDRPPNQRASLRKKLDDAGAELEQIERRTASLRATVERDRGRIETLRELVAVNLGAALSMADAPTANKMLKLAIDRVDVHGRGRGQKRVEIMWASWLQGDE
jgi:site-specific DNA recombinase